MSSLNEPRVSSLLTPSENEQCLKFMSTQPLCTALTVGVVQLLLTEAPAYDQWQKQATGVAGLIRDNGSGQLFVQVFDFPSEKLVWEYDIGSLVSFVQFADNVQFCFFQTEAECSAGLLFADAVDIRNFKEVLAANENDDSLPAEIEAPKLTKTVQQAVAKLTKKEEVIPDEEIDISTLIDFNNPAVKKAILQLEKFESNYNR